MKISPQEDPIPVFLYGVLGGSSYSVGEIPESTLSIVLTIYIQLNEPHFLIKKMVLLYLILDLFSRWSPRSTVCHLVCGKVIIYHSTNLPIYKLLSCPDKFFVEVLVVQVSVLMDSHPRFWRNTNPSDQDY